MINISKNIFKPEPDFTFYGENKHDVLCMIITPRGPITGFAQCAEDDDDFFSQRFGKRLSLARARRNAVNVYLNAAERDLKTCREFYEACVAKIEEIPVEFECRLWEMEQDIIRLRATRRKLNKEINTMLAAQKKALNSIRDYRSGATEKRSEERRKVLESLQAAADKKD